MVKLELRQVTKRFRGVVALDAISLAVEDGEFFVIVGPNGSGKTTLLRVIAGLLAPDEGTVHIGDRDVTDLPPGRRGVRMVFQGYALYPQMRVYEARRLSNLSFPLRMRKVVREEIWSVVSELARRVGIEPAWFPRKPAELSAGQKQRVAVGRALTISPTIFALDEPLSNLDPQSRIRVREELRRIHAEIGATTLYVTHNLPEALTLADRLAVLNCGAIEQVGRARDVYDHPATEFVRTFLRSHDMPLR